MARISKILPSKSRILKVKKEIAEKCKRVIIIITKAIHAWLIDTFTFR